MSFPRLSWLPLGFVIILLTFSACMTGPLNGDDITALMEASDKSLTLKFEGWVPTPEEKITIQVFDPKDNQWKDLLGPGNYSTSPESQPVQDGKGGTWYQWGISVRASDFALYGQVDDKQFRYFYKGRAVNSKGDPLVTFEKVKNGKIFQQCWDENIGAGPGTIMQNCASEQKEVILWGPSCGQKDKKACPATNNWTCGAGLKPGITQQDILNVYADPSRYSIEGSLSAYRIPPICHSSCGGQGDLCCIDGPFISANYNFGVKCNAGLFCNETFTCVNNSEEMGGMDTHCKWQDFTVEIVITNGTTETITQSLRANCGSDVGGATTLKEFGTKITTTQFDPNVPIPKPVTAQFDNNREVPQ